MPSPQAVTQFYSVLTIVAQVLVVLAVILVLFSRKKILNTNFARWLSRNGLTFAFLVALLAMLGSLYFSEIAHYTPCKLCWYQRIFMYSQVFLLGIAAFKRDFRIKIYGLTLSVIGALIATFHYIEQFTPKQLTSCDVTGFASSCSDRFVANFGYITIPMMALSAFLLIIVFLSLGRRQQEPATHESEF